MVSTDNQTKSVNNAPSSYNNGMNQVSCGTAAEIFGKLDSLLALYKKLMKINNDLTQNQLNFQTSAITNAAEYGRQAAQSQADAIRSRAGQAFVGGGTAILGAGGTALITSGARGLTRNTRQELGDASEHLGRLDALHKNAQMAEPTRAVVVGAQAPELPIVPTPVRTRMGELREGKWFNGTGNEDTTKAAFARLKAENGHEGVFERLQKASESQHTKMSSIQSHQSNMMQYVNMAKDFANQCMSGGLQTTFEAGATTQAGKDDANKNVAQAAQGINSATAEATKQAEAKASDGGSAAIAAFKQAVDKVYQG